MYRISEVKGEFHCSIRYQDGTDEWYEPTKEKAIQSMIRAAYAYNHERINHTMIVMEPVTLASVKPHWKDGKEMSRFYAGEKTPTEGEYHLLQSIRSGSKIVIDSDDFRLTANLLPEEVDMLISIREGDTGVLSPYPGMEKNTRGPGPQRNPAQRAGGAS